MAPSSLAGSLAPLLLLVATVNAQAGAWGQCGGQGWTGATTCIAGWTCVYQNPYYSQCLQSTTTTSTSKTSTSTSTSTSSNPSGSGPSKLIAKTPVLGWNSWNAYGTNINEAKIIAAANSIVSLGLKDAGYTYVSIDDAWSDINGRDSSTQRIKPDLNKFPNGIKSVADTVHGLGLKFGIYSDAGTKTCAGYPGSLYYETIDVQTWNDWGVDLIKYDNCNVPSNWTDSSNPPSGDWYNSNSALRYRRLGAALNTISRPIVFSICNWGNANVWTWGGRVGHQWRLSGDANASWSYIQSIIQVAVNHISYTNFYGHGDMDMMEIGNGALTISEQRTHFAAWCFLKSPILLGTDLSKLSTAQLAIIKNKELLAFSQDTTYGTPAKPYVSGSPPTYFSGTSTAGAHVFMINYNSNSVSMTVNFSAVPELQSKTSWKVHDMWTGTDIGTFSGSYTVSVASHDTAALRFT